MDRYPNDKRPERQEHEQHLNHVGALSFAPQLFQIRFLDLNAEALFFGSRRRWNLATCLMGSNLLLLLEPSGRFFEKLFQAIHVGLKVLFTLTQGGQLGCGYRSRAGLRALLGHGV